jgi:integrase
MKIRTRLQDCAFAASRYGDIKSARYVLRHHADRKRWCDETLRARWDGATALLNWWHVLDPVERPPLDDLKREDARAFLSYLETQGLARSTMKGYRTGASAFTCALRGYQERPVVFDHDYAPFKDVFITPVKKPLNPRQDLELDEVASPLARARLELLFALTALGMSLPEVCSRRWGDVNLKDRIIVGYRGRCLGYGVDVVTALEALLALRPKQHGGQWMLGWQADTAGSWLKWVWMDQVGTGGWTELTSTSDLRKSS